MRKVSLKTIYIIIMTAVFTISFCIFVVLDIQSQREQSEVALLEEARVFADEMDAVWKFMDRNQDKINYTNEGEFEFKGLQCSIVGRSVGAIFSANNDYLIRYTNFNPRNAIGTPDAFEAAALTAFNENHETSEYYRIDAYQDEEKFRYLRALEVDESCLVCHGEPVGEIDQLTGYEKEGWTLDSVGGAISIAIPLDLQKKSVQTSVVRDASYFLILCILIGATIYVATFRFVFKPLANMAESFGKLQEGDLSVSLTEEGKTKEIDDLINRFNGMTEELDSSYSNLEEKIQSRTQDLEKANHTLEELNEKLKQEMGYKSDFLSMVSHELRTPLTSIITFTQIAREAASTSTDEKELQSWREIEKNSHILLGMINNMLDIARSDAGKTSVDLDFLDIGDVVASLKATIVPLAQRVNVKFTAKIDTDVPLVKGDYEKTLRILENLVNNAIKFTQDGGAVQLHVSYDRAEEAVLIKIIDDGIGIAEEDLERIFERFVQVDTGTTRKFSGSGLGLSLVKEYADLQGFDLLVESKLGEGSIFVVRIPTYVMPIP